MPTTISPPSIQHQRSTASTPLRPAPLHQAPIMVATDGSKTSDAALAAARVIGRATGAPIQLLSVVEPFATVVAAPALAAIPSDLDTERVANRIKQIREQRRLLGGGATWTMEVKLGQPASTIARVTKERAGQLLVMGLNRHGAFDRIFGGDTVFDVVRLSESPVLVTPRNMDEMPRTLVVGVDLSPLSALAARTALDLFPSATTAYLVYVGPGADEVREGWRTHDFAYRAALRQGFKRLRHVLEAYPDVRVETVERVGKPVRELLQFANEVHADLIVVGSYRRGLFRRLATGTLASRVVRAADCPVLIVPEPPGADTSPIRAPEHFERENMASQLRELTARNAGRRATVEVDSPAIGAQALVFDYKFLGADYDPRESSMHLFLGDKANGGRRHVTHTIVDPTSIRILRGPGGRDAVVSVAEKTGQMLLTFSD